MAEEIKIVANSFDAAITVLDTKVEAFGAAAHDFDSNMKTASSDSYWCNMSRETYEEGAQTARDIMDQCSRNICFISNLMRQVQLDFEAADAAGAI